MEEQKCHGGVRVDCGCRRIERERRKRVSPGLVRLLRLLRYRRQLCNQHLRKFLASWLGLA